jgi:hypothetical protein
MMRMKRAKSIVLLAAFLLYTAIAIFHPLSHHDVPQEKHSHHECSICLCLNHNTVVISPVIPFLVFLLFFCFIGFFFPSQFICFYSSENKSRAPPSSF